MGRGLLIAIGAKPKGNHRKTSEKMGSEGMDDDDDNTDVDDADDADLEMDEAASDIAAALGITDYDKTKLRDALERFVAACNGSY